MFHERVCQPYMQTGDEREQDEQVFANTCDDASSFDRSRRIYRVGN